MEKDRTDALLYAQCPKMPKMYNETRDKGKVWIRAIARTVKVTGEESYAIVKNDWGRRMKVIKTFGSPAAISSVKAIYPYEWLEKELIPSLKTREEKIAWVAKTYKENEEKISVLNDDEIERLLYMSLMDMHDVYRRSGRM